MLPLIALNHGYKNRFRNGNAGACTFELSANTAPLTDGEPNFSNSVYVDMDYWLDEQNPKPGVLTTDTLAFWLIVPPDEAIEDLHLQGQ